jgi:hypothetical protein
MAPKTSRRSEVGLRDNVRLAVLSLPALRHGLVFPLRSPSEVERAEFLPFNEQKSRISGPGVFDSKILCFLNITDCLPCAKTGRPLRKDREACGYTLSEMASHVLRMGSGTSSLCRHAPRRPAFAHRRNTQYRLRRPGASAPGAGTSAGEVCLPAAQERHSAAQAHAARRSVGGGLDARSCSRSFAACCTGRSRTASRRSAERATAGTRTARGSLAGTRAPRAPRRLASTRCGRWRRVECAKRPAATGLSCSGRARGAHSPKRRATVCTVASS